MPQTEEARTEALELMSVKKNLVTPRNGEPIIAAIQDFITASYLLSKRDRLLDRQQFTQIVSYLGDANMKIDLPPPTIWKPQRLWTGKQVYNLLMRPNKECKVLVNLEAKCRTMHDPPKGYPPDMSNNDGYLVIRNSEIMCGVFDKNTVGDGKKNSVFGVILRDFGTEEAAIAMNRLAKVSARWLATQGFSLGIGDVIPGPRLRMNKEEMVDKAYDTCTELINLAKEGKLENAPGCDAEKTLEQQISGKLSGVREAVGKICMAELSRHNAPLIMATCGSKGELRVTCRRRSELTGQDRSSTSPRWLPVSDSRLSVDRESTMDSKIDRSRTSRRRRGNRPRRDSCETRSSRGCRLPSSSSTPCRVERVWSIPPSRLPRRVIWPDVS